MSSTVASLRSAAGELDASGADTAAQPANKGVRLARGADRAAMLALWERAVRATHHFLSAADVAALKPLVAEELATGANRWWVLPDASGGLAGFLAYANQTIEGLFVDPARQRQGVGRILVAHAQGLGGRALRVDVNEQNAAALRFYEGLGFSVVDRSATDAGGRPFPILHMLRPAPGARS